MEDLSDLLMVPVSCYLFFELPEAIHRNHNSFLTQNIEIMGWGDDSVVKNIPSLSEDALSILAHTLGALNHL